MRANEWYPQYVRYKPLVPHMGQTPKQVEAELAFVHLFEVYFSMSGPMTPLRPFSEKAT